MGRFGEAGCLSESLIALVLIGDFGRRGCRKCLIRRGMHVGLAGVIPRGNAVSGQAQHRRQHRHVESIFPVTLLRTFSMAEPTEQNATREGIAKGE